MIKQISCVSVFISCPSNMSSYIDKLQSLIDEFNELYGFGRGVIFRTVHWKKNIVGQVTEDAQSAINGQLLDEYDLLIALIGDRLGEATARAESGTAEEIRSALSKKDLLFGGKHVQVLFKSKIDTNINQIDVDQIYKVKEFKKAIHKMAIVAEFYADEEIDGIINRFLMSACQQLENVKDSAPVEEELPQSLSDDLGEPAMPQGSVTKSDDSLGFYDEIEIANQATEKQAELIHSYGIILNEMTSDMNRIINEYGDDQQKKRFDLIGDLLSEKAINMEIIVKDIKYCSDKHFSSFENVLLMIEEFDVEGNKEGLQSLRDSLLETSISMAGFLEQAIIGKETTEKSPRATQKFNYGRRRVAKIMGEMIDLVTTIVNRFNEYVSYLEAFLKDSKK